MTSKSNDHRVHLVYILGAGRSGSTILGLLLGAVPNLCYLGEIYTWMRRSGEPNFGGESRARFWEEVKRNASAETRSLFGDRAWREVESSRGLLRLRRWVGGAELRRRYRQASAEVLQLAASYVDERWVVDSSHFPLRLRQLQKNPDLDVRVVYLYRDPRAVVSSFVKGDVEQGRRSRLWSNVYLWATGLLATWAFLKTPRTHRTFISYEDLVADPAAEASRALTDIGVQHPTIREIPPLRTGIAFDGNRLLAQESLTFKTSDGRAPSDAMTFALQLPWWSVARCLRRSHTLRQA